MEPSGGTAPKQKRRAGLAVVALTALLVGTAGGVGGAAVYSATTDLAVIHADATDLTPRSVLAPIHASGATPERVRASSWVS